MMTGHGFGLDVRFGLRQLVRFPGLTVVITLALAVGVGMNTAVFSVIRGVVLQPLPFAEAHRIVAVESQGSDGHTGPVSGQDFLDWQERLRWAQPLGALQSDFATLTGEREPQRVRAAQVTASMFEVMAVPPLLGRGLNPGDQTTGNRQVAVLAHELWANGFGANPAILGSSITINGEQYVVVGVMPPGYNMPSPWSGYALWTPLSLDTLGQDRSWRRFRVFGRLSEGTTLEQAVGETELVAQSLANEYPESNRDVTVALTRLDEALLGDAGRQLLLLLLAAAFVLLIACANIAGLLLARATARGREIAIRAAVGAHRGRVVRQLLTESLILSGLGGLLGLLVALWCINLFGALLPGILPRTDQIGIDWLVLGFAIAISLVAGVVFGLVPAVSASRLDLTPALKEGRATSARAGQGWIRDALVVGQFALTLVLASGAGLMLKSYLRTRGQAIGFSPEQTLVVDISLQGSAYEQPDQRWRYYEDALTEIRALPGIDYVGATSKLPVWGGSNTTVMVEGRDYDPDYHGPLIELSRVFPDYFEALDIPIVQGRRLAIADTAVVSPGAVINQEMARQLFPGTDPIGQRFSWERDPPHWLTVVGVVGDVLQWGLESEPQPEIYIPYTVMPRPRMYVVVRSSVEPASLGPAVRQALATIDRNQPVSGVFTMSDVVAGATARRRFNTLLITIFAAVAIIMATTGIYGVVSYRVTQARKELGIRLALGADPGRTLRLVVGRGFKLAAIGSLLGLGGTYAATRVLSSLLYDVSATDPSVLAAGAAFVLLVGGAGSLVPALRVLGIDPVQVMREE